MGGILKLSRKEVGGNEDMYLYFHHADNSSGFG